jgi:hypothetical protein
MKVRLDALLLMLYPLMALAQDIPHLIPSGSERFVTEVQPAATAQLLMGSGNRPSRSTRQCLR